MDCTKCKLHKTRKQVVSGKGSYDSDILLVGEAPGADEDEWGICFVGDAGSELSDQLRDVGLSFDKCRIENVVKCRPPNNREPELDEILACSDYLLDTIKFMNPKLVITLGKVASQAVVGEGVIRGNIYRWKYGDWLDIPVLPVYHPAWVIYGSGMEIVMRHRECVKLLSKYKEILYEEQ